MINAHISRLIYALITLISLIIPCIAEIVIQDNGKEGNVTPTPVLLTKRGEYVTGDADPDAEELAWMSRFDIIHAGGMEDPLPPEAVAHLRAAGAKVLLVYDWMPAGYHYPYAPSEDNPMMHWLYTHRYTATLNPAGPFPHCVSEGYDWCEDYYYDLANGEVVSRRVDYLTGTVNDKGYDGLFFDWASGLFMAEPDYEPISATYRLRHPDLPYVQAVADFYAALRDEDPHLIIQTNQGFRRAEYHLPIVDYDMTESYVTTYAYYSRTLYVEGQGLITIPETIYYPVSDDEFNGTLGDTLYYLDYLTGLCKEYGGPRFQATVYMNYAAPEYITTGQVISGYEVYTATMPRNAIYFGYAVAKLAGQIAYTEIPENHRLERDEVYFFNLGEPLGETYEQVAGGYVRYYTGGIVLVGEWQTETEVALRSPYIPAGVPVYDAFEDEWWGSGKSVLTVTVRPKPDRLTARMAPSGRLYFYCTSISSPSPSTPSGTW